MAATSAAMTIRKGRGGFETRPSIFRALLAAASLRHLFAAASLK
jgi:hypothetical protein